MGWAFVTYGKKEKHAGFEWVYVKGHLKDLGVEGSTILK